MASSPYKAGKHFLQIPGPSNVPDRILRAMDYPTIDHRGPDFAKIGAACLAGMKTIFKTKSHVVLAQTGHKVKLIRFGQQGVSGAGKKPKTAKEKARRRSFKARHRRNIAKGKMSAAYWSNRVKW